MLLSYLLKIAIIVDKTRECVVQLCCLVGYNKLSLVLHVHCILTKGENLLYGGNHLAWFYIFMFMDMWRCTLELLIILFVYWKTNVWKILFCLDPGTCKLAYKWLTPLKSTMKLIKAIRAHNISLSSIH